MRFENLLAVTHGVERGRTRANRTHAKVPEAIDHPAGRNEPLEVLPELRRIRRFRMKSGDGVGDAILPKVVASRHLAAKTVAAKRDRHLPGVIRSSLHEHGDMQVCEPKRIGNRALLPEVGQSHDDAINSIPILFKQVRAAPGLLPRFDCAVLTLLRSEGNHVHACATEHA